MQGKSSKQTFLFSESQNIDEFFELFHYFLSFGLDGGLSVKPSSTAAAGGLQIATIKQQKQLAATWSFGCVQVPREIRALSYLPPCVRWGVRAAAASARQLLSAASWLTTAINALSEKTEEGALAGRGPSPPLLLHLWSVGVELRSWAVIRYFASVCRWKGCCPHPLCSKCLL